MKSFLTVCVQACIKIACHKILIPFFNLHLEKRAESDDTFEESEEGGEEEEIANDKLTQSVEDVLTQVQQRKQIQKSEVCSCSVE